MRVNLVVTMALSLSVGIQAASVSHSAKEASDAKVKADYLKLPLSFEINQGQADAQVKALARGSGYGLFLTSNESVFVLSSGAKNGSVVKVRTVGANTAAKVIGVDPLGSTSNYFLGNDPSKWRKDVPNFARVKYEAVYPGVDLVYYGDQQQLEYDFVVAPGADPSAISLAIDGVSKPRIDHNGDLRLQTSNGVIYHHKPVVYQQINGSRREVAGHFILKGSQVSFSLGDYDRSRELVIDPSLTFITYLGGSSVDQGKSLAVASLSGITLVAGSTSSTDFPVDAPLYSFAGSTDGFVVALDPNGGTLLASTYIGGSGADIVTGIAVDAAVLPAMLYLAGTTTSTNFPMVNAAQSVYGGGGSDGFVTRISLKVTIITLSPLKVTIATSVGFSTYLGGTGSEAITGIAMDQVSKDPFVTGYTTSSNFPVTTGVIQNTNAGGVDSFVTRYTAATGAPVFSTYLGGTQTDEANAIAVYTDLSTSAVTAYVAGITTSTAFTKTSTIAGPRAFLSALSGNGTTSSFSSFIGTGGASVVTDALAVAADSNGAIYVTGSTNDPKLTTVGPVQAKLAGGGNDAFVAAYNTAGTPTFLSYLGGAGYDKADAIGVLVVSNSDLTTSIKLFVAGYTTGSFPIQSAVQGAYGGGASDGFVTLLETSHGSAFGLGYSTYLGGSGTDVIYGLTVGSSGNARVTGITNSTNLTTTSASYQPALAGSYDAFLAAIQTTP